MAVERKLMTAEELLRLPRDGKRYELIDGELRTLAPAGWRHGPRAFWPAWHLGAHVRGNNLGECFAAETGFIFRRNPDHVRAPDFAFISRDRWPSPPPESAYMPIPADLVLEVVSPGDSATDVREKVEDWLAFGTRAVWVLYPVLRLDVFSPDGSMRSYGPDDMVDGGDVLPGFSMPLRELVGPGD